MKLYFAPRTRSIRPLWLLEEIAAPFEAIKLDLTEQAHLRDDYLAIHPMGEVPALVDGELTLFDNMAICLHLADRAPATGLAPQPGSPERASYYQWIAFAEHRLEPQVLAFLGARSAATDAQLKRMHDTLDIVDAALDGNAHLVGDHFTTADLAMVSILHLAHTLKLLDAHPRLIAYVQQHSQRPALARAVAH